MIEEKSFGLLDINIPWPRGLTKPLSGIKELKGSGFTSSSSVAISMCQEVFLSFGDILEKALDKHVDLDENLFGTDDQGIGSDQFSLMCLYTLAKMEAYLSVPATLLEARQRHTGEPVPSISSIFGQLDILFAPLIDLSSNDYEELLIGSAVEEFYRSASVDQLYRQSHGSLDFIHQWEQSRLGYYKESNYPELHKDVHYASRRFRKLYIRTPLTDSTSSFNM